MHRTAVFCHHEGMKKVLLYLPIVLALLLLAAHFLRYGNTVIVVGIAALSGLLFVRRTWAARIIQLVLVAGTVEWLRTLAMLVQERMALGAFGQAPELCIQLADLRAQPVCRNPAQSTQDPGDQDEAQDGAA